jgi:hypothetical protein
MSVSAASDALHERAEVWVDWKDVGQKLDFKGYKDALNID